MDILTLLFGMFFYQDQADKAVQRAKERARDRIRRENLDYEIQATKDRMKARKSGGDGDG